MRRQVSLYETKTHLSRLVGEAAQGHTIVIAEGGKPLARLGPLRDEGNGQPRSLGQLARQAKGVDWSQWWRDWKAADKIIEADLEAAIAKRFQSPKRPRSRARRR